MPSAYTNIAKPTDATYTGVYSSGRQIYDDSFAYDDSAVFYDSIDENAYTSLSKPTDSIYTSIAKPTT